MYRQPLHFLLNLRHRPQVGDSGVVSGIQGVSPPHLQAALGGRLGV